MKIIVAALAASVLTGCATYEKYAAIQDGFIGLPERVLISAYGPPQNAYTMADGSKLLQYTQRHTAVIPGATTYQRSYVDTSGTLSTNRGGLGSYNQSSTVMAPVQGAPIVIDQDCVANYTVGPDGLVKSWNARGRLCKAK